MSSKLIVNRQQGVSAAVLVVGGIFYWLLCGPAIVRRGYPPIDPIWMAMTYWWVFPLLLSCWFDSLEFASRRWHLCWYAIGTALVDASTTCTIVPRFFSPTAVVFLTIFGYGPAHLVATFVLEAIVQSVLGRWRILSETNQTGEFSSNFSFSLLAWMYCFTVICIALGFPIAGRTFAVQAEQMRGRSRAENDWKNDTPTIYRETEEMGPAGTYIQYQVDRETGFRIRRPRPDFGFTKAYNDHIRGLMEVEHVKTIENKRAPTPQELLELLDAADLREITTFPFDATPDIVLFRKGTMQRWGTTATNSSDSLSIMTKTGNYGVGDGVKPVFVRLPADDQDFVVIRNGKNWLGVFMQTGEEIASISRFP